ncbi:PPC domain-containing protein [Paenibacillus sp. OV219]|uniref:PPC domain-containing protein n=1 Tax=Paenibacillus sp. OV219 TaxID=1884377 RepID=UPI0008BCF05B|nr:PPC domain-containing protein [Paenibacillus sp. OV219]SEO51421.1 pre-peptidase C-terminal domain-containing protein [Paenibacillus sp. OV219]
MSTSSSIVRSFFAAVIAVALLLNVSPTQVKAMEDIGDSLSTAVSIQTNSVMTSTLTTYNDVDYYKFVLDKPGQVTISMKNVSGVTWYYQLFDAEGNSYDWYKSTTGSELAKGYSETPVGLSAGTYYLKVSSNSYSSNEPYEFQLKFVSGDTYEQERNNKLTAATSIALNKKYSSMLQYYGDVDFYKFTTPKDGLISIKIPNLSGSRWYYQLVDADGNPMAWYDSTDNSELAKGDTVTQVGLPAGEYYLKVYGDSYDYSTVDVPYNFTVAYNEGTTYEKENNNTLSSATTIALNKDYTAQLQYYNDTDYYKLHLDKSGRVGISLRNISGKRWYYQLYDGSGNAYSWSGYTDNSQLAKGNSVTYIGLPAGDYYLRVYADSYSYGEAKATYYLAVNYKQGTENELESNDQLSTATNANMNKAYEGALQTNSDSDYYAFRVSVKAAIRPQLLVAAELSHSYYVQLYDGRGNSINVDLKQPIVVQPGVYYVRVSGDTYTYATSGVPYKLQLIAAALPLKTTQVQIANRKGSADSVTVNGLNKGDIIKVYNSKGSLLATSQPVAQGKKSTVISVKQLGANASYVYVTVKPAALAESAKTKISYTKEK